jgi:D-arabinan exo alpha-(1,3)/(1,5)-arabinofuranosidase (non-reducing end)
MTVLGDLLGALTAPPTGRSRRVSSNEQPNWSDGNFDMTPLAPGESLELPLLEGPGVIRHIWCTSHAGGVGELDALSLRIYWDGREEPAVEVPLGLFFAVGQGRPAAVESFPVQVSPSGSLTCYWRMPFSRSARIVITNDNPDRRTGLYWQVDWVQLDALPPETGYFHARYRQEYPAEMGRDYLVADIEGQGQYVGTVMAVTLAQDGWFGEGDDFFFIDGEEVPSLQGTGTEDYFNDAWGFRPRTGPWFGQPRWQGYDAGDSGVCYRWHLLDPVSFTRSLRLRIEHKGNRAESEDGWYIERPDFFSSVAFWYQTGEPKPFGNLPPWPERRVPWEHHHLVRAFRSAKTSGAVGPAVKTLGFFGGRPALVWPNTEPDARLELPFVLVEDGRYAVRLTVFTAPDYGVFDVQLDGETVLTDADFRSTEPGETDLSLGTHELSAGDHTLAFRARPTPPGVAAPLAVETLRLLKLPPEAERAVKTHNEAHFIRLGIGRAVYAYRLAYGELPPSLEHLAESGIMPPRYLTDENGCALESRQEGEYFIVESTAPGGWKHRWQGLDARR